MQSHIDSSCQGPLNFLLHKFHLRMSWGHKVIYPPSLQIVHRRRFAVISFDSRTFEIGNYLQNIPAQISCPSILPRLSAYRNPSGEDRSSNFVSSTKDVVPHNRGGNLIL